jgi:very-short-patch-repair endonuclease
LLRRNQLGFRFRRQFPIPPYFVDFACVEAKLAIEADGSQHAVPGEHDRRDAFLVNKGWQLLRFWNNDILQNREGVLRTIFGALEIRTAEPAVRGQVNGSGRPPPQPSPVATGEGEPRSGWEEAGTEPATSFFPPHRQQA